MQFPLEAPFNEFLRFICQHYPHAEYPEAFIPIIAQKASAGYIFERYFPERLPEFVERNGAVAYAISEPGWKNSPLTLQSRLEKSSGQYTLYANKSFILDAEIAIFVVKYLDHFALVILDSELYREFRIPIDRPESSFQVAAGERLCHHRAEFTLRLPSVSYAPLSRYEMLALARTIFFREQVAYAVLAALEAAKIRHTHSRASRLELLCQRAQDVPSHSDIAIAREILSASIGHILNNPGAHAFWHWLARFAKPLSAMEP
ncbi:MAG: hypothetical protein N2Z22_04790 [Turneriella sp.]|nr:hypothetical protein [Turneriella sp.]